LFHSALALKVLLIFR